jgi:xanthine dehydrogenase molybdopterin-binding subunit B
LRSRRDLQEEIRHARQEASRAPASYVPTTKSPDQNGLTGQCHALLDGRRQAGVELEVDTETGRVRFTPPVNVADVRQPINPRIVETQLSGAAIMQLGFSLFEKMQFDTEGSCATPRSPNTRSRGCSTFPAEIVNEAWWRSSERPFGGQGRGR